MTPARRRLVVRLAIATVVGAAVMGFVMTTRDYPWYLAAVVGAAGGFLAFYVFRTADNLRGLFRS